MTIFSAYNDTKNKLREAGIEPYVFEAKQIIRFVTKYSNAQILEKYMEPLDPIKELFLKSVVAGRVKRIPLQYLLGEWSFFGYDFFVGKGVLCPRPDTETLVEVALDLVGNAPAKIADLCAGSGCVGISVAKEKPITLVTAVEKYDAAYDFLTRNIEKNGAENVIAVKADIETYETNEKFDLILSNPPYISREEMSTIDEETKNEPETALFGGEDGLDFYKIILDKWLPRLNEGGSLAVEVGAGMAERVKELFIAAGLKNVKTREDINEIERVVYGTL
ncbi:MAG: peptide chain release factor N(5)-glutamine methyltransferase [Clostridia bacterium]|nr:peptide chain release factor N(5)-glutamine methyltransferase [Clostridia bacterium]MBQ8304017.1 peptide chain release factor N(5)-glutamine methyltransferase [Clostridia bacterium]